ncbi:hypothetical protein L2E82_53343 [Cichorium intybus]|nr:hypothetical protein L2E82_53343 [Cichorium intybus]
MARTDSNNANVHSFPGHLDLLEMFYEGFLLDEEARDKDDRVKRSNGRYSSSLNCCSGTLHGKGSSKSLILGYLLSSNQVKDLTK